MTDSNTETETSRFQRLPSFQVVLIGALGVLAMLWVAPTIAAAVADINLADVQHLYAIITGFVILDAVIPVFPSESLLTTASNLAAQSGSNIELWKLVAAGTIGAILGDSLLYWLSRTVLRKRMSVQVDRAQENEKVARAMEVMSGTAPLLIVFGRFVPGLRFMIGATMGLTRFPYARFLVWDVLGSFLWAAYTCVFCYLVASIIEDQPLLSIAVSVVVTTGLLALLYRPLKRHWDAAGEPAPRTD
ncbi:MAG: DedA family protein [Ilumatobacteraceae bacterium]